MVTLPKFVIRTLSVRLSLMVVFAVAILLMATLFITFRFSRNAIQEEALAKAEQTLEGAVHYIDNTMFSVELAATNMLWNVERHLDRPDRMFDYSRKLVELNPNVVGGAIAFEPDYYPAKGQHFMAYSYRSPSGEVVTSQPSSSPLHYSPLNFHQQPWYTTPMKTGKPFWAEPNKTGEASPAIITYSVPVHDESGRTVGVMGLDLSLGWLSQTLLDAKPSANSYCTLLGRDGTYIIHSDTAKLRHQNVLQQLEGDADTSALEAAKAMLSGQAGYRLFHMNGKDCYVFYKPFKNLGWSAGVIYPEDDIFNSFKYMPYYVVGIAVVSLLLMMLLCLTITRRQLAPLRLLTQSAQRITEGRFDELIPDSNQQDEIGQLQDNFRSMQQSLATYVTELGRLTDSLKEKGEVLREAYERSKEADKMKTDFLHNMSDQMLAPISAINMDVGALQQLCVDSHLPASTLPPQSSKFKVQSSKFKEKASNYVDDIQHQGHHIVELLNHLLDVSLNKRDISPLNQSDPYHV